jgi:hypothetical protein
MKVFILTLALINSFTAFAQTPMSDEALEIFMVLTNADNIKCVKKLNGLELHNKEITKNESTKDVVLYKVAGKNITPAHSKLVTATFKKMSVRHGPRGMVDSYTCNVILK